MKNLFLSLYLGASIILNLNLAQAANKLPENCKEMSSVPVELLMNETFMKNTIQMSKMNSGIEGNSVEIVYCEGPRAAELVAGIYYIIHNGYEMPGPHRPSKHSVYFTIDIEVYNAYPLIKSVNGISMGYPDFK